MSIRRAPVIKWDRQTPRLVAAVLLQWAAVCIPAALAMAAPIELRVMSFNIRYSYGGFDESRTENNWTDAKHPRRERAVRVIREYMPDVIGVQEARHLQVVDLREALPEFDFYGVGRDDGKTDGEYAGIFYRKDRFLSAGEGTFWLSQTPEKPGTSFYRVPGAVPRLASWVRLREKTSTRQFLVLNTHWDHISAAARRKSASLIRQQVASLANEIPAIVMGDLNTPEDSAPLRELMGAASSSVRRLMDSYRALHRDRSSDESTFNHWQGTTAGSRIDFILHTEEFQPTAAAIVRTSYDGLWPSDHYPVTATLQLEKLLTSGNAPADE